MLRLLNPRGQQVHMSVHNTLMRHWSHLLSELKQPTNGDFSMLCWSNSTSLAEFAARLRRRLLGSCAGSIGRLQHRAKVSLDGSHRGQNGTAIARPVPAGLNHLVTKAHAATGPLRYRYIAGSLPGWPNAQEGIST